MRKTKLPKLPCAVGFVAGSFTVMDQRKAAMLPSEPISKGSQRWPQGLKKSCVVEGTDWWPFQGRVFRSIKIKP